MRENSTSIAIAARRLLLAALLGAAASAPAQAQSVMDAERCATAAKNPDLAIQSCTRAVESRKFSGQALSRLHYHRGVGLAVKGTYEGAVADFDAAIRLDPKFAAAHFARGNGWSSRGDSDRAIADFDAALRLDPGNRHALEARAYEWAIKGDYAKAIADRDAAIRLDPKSADSLFGRGRARYYAGDFARAVADIEEAMNSDANTYTALWLYLARRRAGADDAESRLRQDTAAGPRDRWPAAVVALYLERTDVASVIAASSSSDPGQQRERGCEANFYIAQWLLLREQREEALRLLKDARSGCPRDILEYEGTVAELRRLAK